MSKSAVTETESITTITDFGPPADAIVDGPPISPEQFKACFRNLPAGVAVITADAGDGPVGLTATSVISISAEPPLFVFSISTHSSSMATLLKADTLVVQLLSAHHHNIAELCSTSGAERFGDSPEWKRLPTGEPYYVDVPMWIRGRVAHRVHAGQSTVFIIEAIEANVPEPETPLTDAENVRPLVYHNRTWHELSGASKLDAS